MDASDASRVRTWWFRCSVLTEFKDIPCPSIRWLEESGASLVSALKDYMGLCLNLETKLLCQGATPLDLASRIDFTLGGVHTLVSHYLEQSTRALARTRNKLASHLHKLPEEVLSEIFLKAIFTRDNSEGTRPSSTKQDVRLIYRRLYNLIGVCSIWKDILMVRGIFWSVIPMVGGLHTVTELFELSLQRAGGCMLHLAADGEANYTCSEFAEVLVEYGHWFRAINFSTYYEYDLNGVVDALLKHTNPGTLSDLSIQYSEAPSMVYDLPSNYIVSHKSPQQVLFDRLVQSLTALRLYGINIHWDTMAFSERLVELRLEQVVLGYDDDISPFIKALSSAQGLRDLKIILVLTFRRPNVTLDLTRLPAITFPNLKSLLLQGLFFNTLKHLLPMIPSGSHTLTVFLTEYSIETHARLDEDYLDDGDLFDFNGLCHILKNAPVNTLMLNGQPNGSWVKWARLRRLLYSMPQLKTLKLDNWGFGDNLWKWKHLMGDPTSQSPTEDDPFPELENLHLSLVRINRCFNKAFQKLVACHPLRRVVLGGTISVPDEQDRWEPLNEGDSIVKWLREKVADVHLLEKDYHPPEFELAVWRLW